MTSSTIKAELLHKLILSYIRRLLKIGLIVKAVICDQGTNNQKCMSKFANILIEKPFFTIDTYKIYVIFDPPYLLKNIRNNFKK